jgi:ubiquinone/menaquinone biosynthesis C-methylase UbiE
MALTAYVKNSPVQPLIGKQAGCLPFLKNRQLTDWTIAQLNIQPYQHLLEVGYGHGYTLDETARRLKVGFLAGTDPSLSHHQQVYRRNKRFIRQQLLQLHIGQLHELPYPPHYFHTIYSINAYLSWQDPSLEFMRLYGLLKSGGRLIMVFQPPEARKEEAVRKAVGKISEEYREAGFSHSQIEYRHLYPATAISVTGFKD